MNKLLKSTLVIICALVLTSGLAIAGCSSGSTLNPGEELPTHQLEINLLGEKNEFPVDSQRTLKSDVKVSSPDGKIALSMDKGTTVLGKDGKVLQLIQVTTSPGPPPAPGNAYVVSSVYNLEPQGATFSPRLLFTLSYDPSTLPEGLKENALYIACHDGTKWYKLPYKKVDTKLHSVSAQLHDFNFTSVAILRPKESSPPTHPTPTPGIKVGNLAPDFQLHNLEGKPVSLSDFRGKSVILNFWATWCGPCVFEMPYLQQVYEEYSANGLVLLAVNIDASSSKVTKFLQGHNLSLPVLLDTKQNVARRYNTRYIPTTFFIDKDGIIQVVKVGAFPNKEAIEGDIDKIMP